MNRQNIIDSVVRMTSPLCYKIEELKDENMIVSWRVVAPEGTTRGYYMMHIGKRGGLRMYNGKRWIGQREPINLRTRIQND